MSEQLAPPSALYKWLDAEGVSCHGGYGKWDLPNGKPGKWRRVHGQLVPCKNGIHLCRAQDLLGWCAPRLFVAEHGGALVIAENKVVVRKARLLREVTTWNDRIARLFACDCAERALKAAKVADERSYNTIAVARRFANGNATAAELDAAHAAAQDAARTAAHAAAHAAVWAAQAVAWDAAHAAAHAAWNTEREWRTQRLLAYLNGEV